MRSGRRVCVEASKRAMEGRTFTLKLNAHRTAALDTSFYVLSALIYAGIMSHLPGIPSSEACSAGFQLLDLSIEILGAIFALVDSRCLGRLALSGDHRLHAKLAQKFVVKELSIVVPAGNTKWPSAVSFFPQLHSLTVQCAANAHDIPLEGFKAEHLSKELRNVHFSFANDFVCFMELDSDYADMPPYNSDGLRLIDMDEVLPHLESFEYAGSVKYSELYPLWPSYLPRSLQSIQFQPSMPFSLDMVAELPRSLKEVELTLGGWSQITVGEIDSTKVWPQGLATLKLIHSSLSVLPSLPLSLTHLELHGLSTDSLFGARHLWKHLEKLQSLNTLSTRCLKLDSEFALLMQKFANLTDLRVQFTECDSMAIRFLPASLQKLELTASIIDGSTPLWYWNYLPKDLLHLATPWLGLGDVPEQWKHVPRRLQNFSLSTRSMDPDDIVTFAKDLPPSITNLTVTEEIANRMDFFTYAAHLSKSLTSLSIDAKLFHDSMKAFLHGCHSLKELSIRDAPLKKDDMKDFPFTLRTLSCFLRDPISDYDFITPPWSRQLTKLHLQLGSVTVTGPKHYASLPRSLTWLRIINRLPTEGFEHLPRSLTFLDLRVLSAAIDDDCLASLPPFLETCYLYGLTSSPYTLQGLLSLPMTLSQMVLPPSHMTYAEFTPFLEMRPYVDFRLVSSRLPQSEEIFAAYRQKKLTLGSVRARYEYS